MAFPPSVSWSGTTCGSASCHAVYSLLPAFLAEGSCFHEEGSPQSAETGQQVSQGRTLPPNWPKSMALDPKSSFAGRVIPVRGEDPHKSSFRSSTLCPSSIKMLPHKRNYQEYRVEPVIYILIPLFKLFGLEIRKKKTYIMSYDKDTKNTEWVYEILNKQTVKVRNKYDNVKILRLHFAQSLNLEGYDRGHLAAAANHSWCQEAYNDTFSSTNTLPQLSVYNQGMWKYLEEMCRAKLKASNIRNVHVYTGPIYPKKGSVFVDQQSNGSKKAVPDYLFKVIIVEDLDGTVLEPECYKFPNSNSLDEVYITHFLNGKVVR
ncbi:endonuclease G, mitochondrial-like [Danio aesculapii]|uniref:endonuclease G, mitochondrial-like n=1 Tax=Danio aesculapii TaxID=1142201 RepID=UPI0024C07577|nr:endonuclease G, mitochondrial-like [Danio aesculapii]